MRVAVVSAYYKEPIDVLRRCHDSVMAQTSKDVFHIMVADGFPHSEVDNWNVTHVKAAHNNDYGDTPRAIGALTASSLGADAITLLDGDNWLEPDHVETLERIHVQTGAQVVTTTRMLRRMDGSVLGVCYESNGKNFNDTNCYFLTKPTFISFMSCGFKDRRDCIVGDRMFWDTIQRMGYSRIHCMIPTTNYVTSFACHYLAFGEAPPPGAKVIVRFAGHSHSQMVSFVDFEKIIKGEMLPPAAP